MIRSRTILLTLGMLGLVGRSLLACAGSDSLDGELKSSEAEAGVFDDASTGDAQSDVVTTDVQDASIDDQEICSSDGWCHTLLPKLMVNDGGDGRPVTMAAFDLRDVWVAPNHDAWAISREGEVLRRTGDTWNVVFEAHAPLRALWGASASDVWITGDKGLLLHGTAVGGVFGFEPVSLDSSDDVLRVWGSAADDVWVVTARHIYHHTGEYGDGGAPAFAIVPFPNAVVQAPGTEAIVGVWGQGSDVWISGREFTDCSTYANVCCLYENCDSRFVLARWKGVDRTALDGGDPNALWDRISLDSQRLLTLGITASTTDDRHFFLTIAFPGPGAYFGRVVPTAAVDAGDAVDAGTHAWTLEDAPPFGSTPEDIWTTSSDDVWLIGSPGIVRHWDGAAWKVSRVTTSSVPLTTSLHAIHGVVEDGKRDLWVVGNGLALHRREHP